MRRFALLAPAVLILAACSGGETPASSDAPAPAAPTVTITVTAEPEPAGEPAAPRADFGFTYFEEAEIGHTFAQAGAALGMPVAGNEVCDFYGAIWNTEIATTYAFTDSRNPGGGITFFYTQQFLGSPSDSWPRNPEGLGIGSTKEQVLAAYPSATVGSVEDMGAGQITTITVDDAASGSRYVFGFSGDGPTADLLQWGPGAGTQWSHLCGGV